MRLLTKIESLTNDKIAVKIDRDYQICSYYLVKTIEN